MKKLFCLVACCFMLIALAGCYEVNEEITINANGSGTYRNNMDMSQLLELLQNFGGEDALTKEGLDKPVDTTIQLADVMKKVNDSSIRKDLFKDGKLDIKFNAQNRIFKTNVLIPFAKQADLEQLMAGGGNGAGLAEAFKNIFSKQDTAVDNRPIDKQVSPDLDQFSQIYVYSIRDGVMSRKIDKAKYDALMERPEVQQAKQMAGSGMEITYNTVIHLPRPAKKLESSVLQLSADKKTVSGKFNMLDLFDNPDKFSYTITY